MTPQERKDHIAGLTALAQPHIARAVRHSVDTQTGNPTDDELADKRLIAAVVYWIGEELERLDAAWTDPKTKP